MERKRESSMGLKESRTASTTTLLKPALFAHQDYYNSIKKERQVDHHVEQKRRRRKNKAPIKKSQSQASSDE